MDKEKFRKEVERLKSQLLKGACSYQIAMETRCKEEAYNDVLAILDSLQEEPVNRTPADIEAAMQEVEEKSRVFTEAHKGEDTDTILAQMRGEEPVSEDLEKIVEEIAEPTILNAYGTKELARRLRNTICGISISENLDEYINELSKQFPEVSFAKLSRIAVRVAKWKEQKMMAKAIDGYVIKDVEEGNGDFLLSAEYLPKSMGLKDQQRVKVIVIKE